MAISSVSTNVNSAWYMPDVHVWTQFIRSTIKEEMPDLPLSTRQHIQSDDPRVMVETTMYPFYDHVRKWLNAVAVKNVITKIAERALVLDPELENISPAGLLLLIFELVQMIEPVKENEEPTKDGAWKALFDTLVETAGTCIQGDTHRMFALLVVLVRERKDFLKKMKNGEKDIKRILSAKELIHVMNTKNVVDMFAIDIDKTRIKQILHDPFERNMYMRVNPKSVVSKTKGRRITKCVKQNNLMTL